MTKWYDKGIKLLEALDMTGFEAHKMLIDGKITLDEYRVLTQPTVSVKPVIKKQSLKNFLPCKDANVITDFTVADLDKWEEKSYFRFQCLEWTVGEKSFGMIYSTAKEARAEGSTVLDGKSCVSEWRQLYQFWDSFSTQNFCILVFTGTKNGYGHDGECVVKPEKVIAVLDCKKFMEIVNTELEKAETEQDYEEVRRFGI
jgi:hypothetical protein